MATRARLLRPPRPRLPRRLDHGEEATLVEHLDELRQRLFFCLAAIVVTAVIGFVLHTHLIQLLVDTLPGNAKLTTLTVGEAFMMSVWVSIYFAVLVSTPIIFWQFWSFFVPAIDKQHARLIKWFVLLAGVLMITGILFGYYITLPAAEAFLTNYDDGSGLYANSIQARPFLTFCVQVLVAMAVVFELPLFVVGLTRLGILKTDRLRRQRRLGYFLTACLAVALPGVDPVTVTLEVIPLLVLFELSIWISVLLDKRSKRMKNDAAAAA